MPLLKKTPTLSDGLTLEQRFSQMRERYDALPETETGAERFKAKNVLYSLSYAWEGLCYVVQAERNFRIHLGITAIAITLAAWLGFALIEWALLWGMIALVLFAELMNTAIELLVDAFTQGEFNWHAKIIKDVAAGAVLITAVCAVGCGVCLYVPHLLRAASLIL